MPEHEPPLVSVVIPCLNRAAYLRPTIESVLKQDYPRVECIVVDGGSTDGTLQILKEFGERIKWISEPDKGHADAINKGWRMSKGQILAWLNADDLWEVPDAARRAADFLVAHPEVDVVYGDCGTIDEQGNLIGMTYLHEWDLEYAVVNCDHCIPQPAAFIRRRILEKVGWLDTAIFAKDRELWLRIGLVGRIVHIPGVLAYARSIEGISQDGRRMAPACVQISRKFFSMPGVPAAIRAQRRRAMSNAYLRGMHYAFEGGRCWDIIFKYALRAALADPTNALRAYRELRGYVARAARTDPRFRRLLRLMNLTTLPRRALARAQSALLGGRPQRMPNLFGDRDVEWSFIAARIPNGPGQALDFGCGGGPLGLLAALRGFDVTGVDLTMPRWPYEHPRLRFVMGDILALPLPQGHFDLVINCSSVEHVGLAGRYGVAENRPDGDLEAMQRLRRLMKPGGLMLLTVPVGRDATFWPMTRVYGQERLPRLLEGFCTLEEQYWIKDEQNNWVPCDRATALAFEAAAGSQDPLQNVYALGMFVLRRATEGG